MYKYVIANESVILTYKLFKIMILTIYFGVHVLQ